MCSSQAGLNRCHPDPVLLRHSFSHSVICEWHKQHSVCKVHHKDLGQTNEKLHMASLPWELIQKRVWELTVSPSENKEDLRSSLVPPPSQSRTFSPWWNIPRDGEFTFSRERSPIREDVNTQKFFCVCSWKFPSMHKRVYDAKAQSQQRSQHLNYKYVGWLECPMTGNWRTAFTEYFMAEGEAQRSMEQDEEPRNRTQEICSIDFWQKYKSNSMVLEQLEIHRQKKNEPWPKSHMLYKN